MAEACPTGLDAVLLARPVADTIACSVSRPVAATIVAVAVTGGAVRAVRTVRADVARAAITDAVACPVAWSLAIASQNNRTDPKCQQYHQCYKSFAFHDALLTGPGTASMNQEFPDNLMPTTIAGLVNEST